MRRRQIPYDSLLLLRQRLDRLPHKSSERAAQVTAMATLYGLSTDSVYRALREFNRPKTAHRADQGRPRVLQQAELERYCELVAALKLRTTNKNGRHLSTARAVELLEDYGVETSQGLVKAAKGAAEQGHGQSLFVAVASGSNTLVARAAGRAFSGRAQQ